MIKNIAIVGTGFSAATLGYFIKEDIDFYEKSKSVGGRCSTRKVENVGLFDHGLQYLESLDPEFKIMLNEYSIWQGNFKIFHKNQIVEDVFKERLIHQYGNNLLIKNLFKNKKIFFNKKLEKIEKKNNYFLLTFEDGAQSSYKTVIVTAPYQQSYNLTKQFTKNYFFKYRFLMKPNLTVMIAFNKSLQLNFSAIKFEDDDVLSFAANENTKKTSLINNELELWTIQSSVSYAVKNINEYKNKKNILISEILNNFTKKLKINFQKEMIYYSDIHGWLYAYNLNCRNSDYFWDSKLRLGICGDWFSGANAQNAFFNAKYLASNF